MTAYDEFLEAVLLERFTPEPRFSERQISAMERVMELLAELLSSESASKPKRSAPG